MKMSFDLLLLYFHMCKRMVILREITSVFWYVSDIFWCFSFGINYTLFIKFHFTHIIITLNLTRKSNFFNPNLIRCISVFCLFICLWCFCLFAFVCVLFGLKSFVIVVWVVQNNSWKAIIEAENNWGFYITILVPVF